MKMRLLALLLTLVLTLGLVAALSACGEDAPVADEPTADNPTTEDPTEEDPTTEDPTEEPTVEDPTTEDPTEEPTVEDPTTEEPTEEPTVEDPTTEDPTKEPTTEEPTVEDPTTEEPTVEDPTEETKTEVVLIKDGVANFKFVVADGFSAELNMAVGKLVDELKRLGVTTESVFDNKDTITECEVLIGSVQSRGDEYKLDPHVYGWDGYTIQAVGTKIVVLGGSDESLEDAIAAFKKDILGIKKSTSKLTNVSMTSEQKIEVFNDPYDIESVTIGGNNLRDFVIAAKSSVLGEKNTAVSVQTHLYKKTGLWLPIVEPDEVTGSAIYIELTTARTCSSAKGFKLTVSDGSVYIDCGFENKIEEATLGFFMTEVTNSKNPTVTINNGLTYEKVDYRNIYYNDFGARGDGYTDDFEEILAAHEYANKYGHTVNANKGYTYYFGTEYQKTMKVIPIMTDVNWTGANFIIDDSVVHVQRNQHADRDNNRVCDHCKRGLSEPCSSRSDSWHKLSLFSVRTSYETYNITEYFAGRALNKSDTNIGFAPGYTALILLQNNNIRHFIRYGVNENAGSAQTEIIIVDKDGNLDPTTPLHWTYETVTYATMKCVEDDPITIQGGDFQTISNQSENYYDSYGRNIAISRSNVTLKNIKHSITNEGPTRAPYGGFTSTSHANNVRFENMTIQHHVNRYDAGTGALLGTYEIGATYANNLQWININQSNFFEEDGSVSYKGLFGTNYCKNFYFDGCNMTSLDAHCGLYNGTVKNSTFEHMNFIGEGLIEIENVTIYADAAGCTVNLRSDYGSTWQGDIIVDGLTMKYSRNDLAQLQLCSATYTDWWFGYTTYLPQRIELNNVKLIKYTQVTDALGNRTETVVAENEIPFYLFSKGIYGFGDKDISKLVQNGGAAQNNPYVGTKIVKISNCGNLRIPIPKKQGMFGDLEYWLDGVEQEVW